LRVIKKKKTGKRLDVRILLGVHALIGWGQLSRLPHEGTTPESWKRLPKVNSLCKAVATRFPVAAESRLSWCRVHFRFRV